MDVNQIYRVLKAQDQYEVDTAFGAENPIKPHIRTGLDKDLVDAVLQIREEHKGPLSDPSKNAGIIKQTAIEILKENGLSSKAYEAEIMEKEGGDVSAYLMDKAGRDIVDQWRDRLFKKYAQNLFDKLNKEKGGVE